MTRATKKLMESGGAQLFQTLGHYDTLGDPDDLDDAWSTWVGLSGEDSDEGQMERVGAKIALANYIQSCRVSQMLRDRGVSGDHIHEGFGSAIESGGAAHESTAREVGHLWHWMRAARVFMVPADVWLEVHATAYAFGLEVIAGMSYPITEEWSAEEQAFALEQIEEEGHQQLYPDSLPFDSIFLTFDRPILIPLDLAVLRFGMTPTAELAEIGARAATLDGFVMTRQGETWSFCSLYADDGRTYTLPSPVHTHQLDYLGDGWVKPQSMDAWALPMLIDMINDNVQTRVQKKTGLQLKLDFQKKARAVGFSKKFRPPVYYETQLCKGAVARAKRKLTCTKAEAMYKHDVRGHWRMRAQREDLPLSAERRGLLEKREYVIHTATQVPLSIAKQLRRRGHHPLRRAGEWLAYKLTWVQDHISPAREDLPYVPSIHMMKSGQLVPKPGADETK